MRSAAGTARLFVRDPMAGFQVPVLTREKKGPHSGVFSFPAIGAS
jgi:hypothetical protein